MEGLSFPGSSPATLEDNKRRWILVPVALSLIAFALYLNTFGNDFTNWDDNRYITENPRIRDLGLAGIGRIFGRFYFSDFAPVTLLSYSIDYAYWRLNPVGYHLTNTVLHALNAALLFWVLLKVTARLRAAAAAALLFAVHPIEVESVAWMAQRKTLLAMTFFLLAFLQHLRSRERDAPRRTAWLTWLFYLLAVLSKPVVVGAPVLFSAYDRWFCRLGWREIVRRNLPLFTLGVLGAIAGIVSQYVAGGVKSYPGGSILRTLLLMIEVLWDYLASLALPLRLDNLYIYNARTVLHHPAVPLGLGAVAAIVYLALRQPLGRPATAFGLLWFGVFLLPVLNIVPMAVQRADRYMYFPSVGVFLLAALAFDRLLEWTRSAGAGYAAVVAGLGIALVAWYGYRTFHRNQVWLDSRTLWEDHLKMYPRSTTGHFNLAGYYLARREYDRAVPLYEKLLELDPRHMKALYDLARIAFERGELDRAIAYYQRAARLEPREKVLWNNLGYAFFRKGMYREAADVYQEALRIDPRYVKARTNLGYAYLRLGSPERALGSFEAAQVLDPRNPEAARGAGMALLDARDFERAAAAFEGALRFGPPSAELFTFLAESHRGRGDPQAALACARRAVELDPTLERPLVVLGQVYAALGEKQLAEESYRRAAALGAAHPTRK